MGVCVCVCVHPIVSVCVFSADEAFWRGAENVL